MNTWHIVLAICLSISKVMFTLCFRSPGFGPEVDREMVIKARLLAASSLVPLYEAPAKQGRVKENYKVKAFWNVRKKFSRGPKGRTTTSALKILRISWRVNINSKSRG